MIHAFLDESGTNEETPVLSVAGFYGTQYQWDAFLRLWKPAIHGKTFHALYSSKLFPALCDAIEASTVHGMLCTVSKKVYRLHAGEHFKSFLGNCYAICAFMCALAICDQVKPQSVSIVLEQGQPNLSFVKRILEAMKDAGEYCIAAVASAQKKDFVQLHAADFASHVASSHDVAWMQKLFDARRLKHAHITEKMIIETSPQVKALVNRARNARLQAKRNR